MHLVGMRKVLLIKNFTRLRKPVGTLMKPLDYTDVASRLAYCSNLPPQGYTRKDLHEVI